MYEDDTVNIFHGYDSFIIVASLLLTCSCLVILFLPFSESLSTASDYYVMTTHILVLPSMYLASKTRWLSTLIGLTGFISILYHSVKIANIQQKTVLKFQLADESAQAVLIWLSTLLFIYEDFPLLGIPVLFFVGIIVAVFADTTLLDVSIDNWIVGIAITIMMFFLLYKLFVSKCNFNSDFFRYKRVWEFIVIGFGFFVLAIIFYTLGTNYTEYSGKKKIVTYNLLHSGWHICAYSALFFIFRSRVKPLKTLLNTVRIRRTQFAINNQALSVQRNCYAPLLSLLL